MPTLPSPIVAPRRRHASALRNGSRSAGYSAEVARAIAVC
jgi:hypothetical protein